MSKNGGRKTFEENSLRDPSAIMVGAENIVDYKTERKSKKNIHLLSNLLGKLPSYSALKCSIMAPVLSYSCPNIDDS